MIPSAMGLGLTILAVTTFALWATLHTLLSVRILRTSVVRGLLTFLCPLLAPVYGQSQPKLLSSWAVGLAVYGTSLVLALVVG